MELKKPLLFLILLIVGISCKRNLSHTDVENKLKRAMVSSFYKAIHDDSVNVKFEVLTVNYFEEKNYYECDFNVHLRAPGKDTLGVMGARISKDFSRVTRKF